MNLLDKYVTEVGKHLPHKNRADIQAEIRSTLQDMLDERSAAAGKPIDDALTTEVLKEYGAPAKVAESYRGAQYLIGPRLYPFFEMVVKIVISVLLGVALLSFGLNFANNTSGPGFVDALGQFLAQLVGGIIVAFGNIVIIFAILERVLPPTDLEKDFAEKEWDPAELLREPDPDRVKASEMIATVVFTAIGLAILNLYPNLIGFAYTADGRSWLGMGQAAHEGWVFIPLLTDAFFGYLPWINLLGVLQIGFSLVMLRTGAWKTPLRIINIIIESAGIALAGVMLAGPALVYMDPAKLMGFPSTEAANTLATMVNLSPVIALSVVIIVGAIEVAHMVYKLIKGKPVPFVPTAQ